MSQETFERTVAGVLLVGVAVSGVLIVLGMISALAWGWGGSGASDIDPTDFSGLLERVRQGQPLAITQLGLVVLILTPVVRVAFSAVAFALERDRIYLVITLTVLAILVASLLLFR